MILFFIIFIYLIALLLLLKELLFFVYLTQLKEYRLDRIKDFLKTPEGMGILKTRAAFIFFFFIYFFLDYFVRLFNQSGKEFTELLLAPFVLYSLFIFISLGRALLQLKSKKTRLPVFSTRAVTVLAGAFCFMLICVFISYETFFDYLEVYLLGFIIFSPFFILASILASYPVALYLKRRIISKAKKKREAFKNLLVIGVTGSYGKTSVKEYLFHLLKRQFRVLKTEEHVNTEMGVAGTVLTNLKKEHQIFIVEMGAYKKGEIAAISNIVKPSIGIITGINEQHISLFGSIENILKAKAELAVSLPQDGLLVLNADNKYCALIGKHVKRKNVYYSFLKKTDLSVKNFDLSLDGTEFMIKYENKLYRFKTKLIGKHNLQNLLGVILIALKLGISNEIIKNALMELYPPKENFEIRKKKNLTLIDSSYNLNPASIGAANELMNLYKGYRKIAVLDDILELGKKTSMIHYQVGKKLSKLDHLYLIGKNYASIVKKAAMEAGMKKSAITQVKNKEAIVATLRSFRKEKVVIVFLGKGTKTIFQNITENV